MIITLLAICIRAPVSGELPSVEANGRTPAGDSRSETGFRAAETHVQITMIAIWYFQVVSSALEKTRCVLPEKPISFLPNVAERGNTIDHYFRKNTVLLRRIC